MKITVKKEENAVISFSVEDNGCGMSGQKLEEILKPDLDKKGVGVWNINQRIKLLYGNSIRIESEEGIGTRISFDIPAQ